MKKLFILILLIFEISCVTKPSVYSLNFNKIRNLEIGKTTEIEAKKIFGNPISKTQSENYYTVQYNDHKTGAQRLSLSFTSKDKILSSILWVPKVDENEYTLEGAKAGFKNSDFKDLNESDENPHALSSGNFWLVDKNLGVTIRYNKEFKTVDAIGLYSSTLRVPTEQSEREKTPYTFAN